MKKLLLLLVISFSVISAQINFDDYFVDKTMRLDFFHTGDKTSETISFDKLIEEGIWSGSKKNLLDKLQFGHYMLKVLNPTDKQEIYSRGFSTLYQEWQTTEESKTTIRSMQGSVCFPFPKSKILVELYRRDKKNVFQKLFEKEVDPSSYFIIKEKIKPFTSFKVHYSGESSNKLDIVFIPEGYNKDEMTKFKDDCTRFSGYLFDYSPFKENKSKINIWGVEAPSSESETDIPGKGIWKQTILNSRFYTFDSERYLMTSDYHTVKDVAANAPYDQIFILVNTTKYGGGAIYNFYSMTSAYDKRANQIFVHEFAHGLAGLADEYGNDNTYQDMYPTDVEPWEPNLTTMVNFESKWKHLIEAGTPIPTPSEEMYKNKIGVFEGGGYVAKGVYRPTFNSIMNSFSSNEFNLVCKEALEKVINFYAE
ncbi:MAG: peptidase M64 [Stygiobacter sp.]|nr:MAG: peptidase M64 [Stygiobacter sp. GWC2_38_9]OGV06042.1 MAG: peptidase M64 [Stygiobacter sp. RIFOXYB2_FULL_37_11]OGV13103.1 MAG: peptidase M64 [Stygiobacter sp. RIFOXYA2_FULL_38_8]OGV16894.1 MAG: peptidase M64 [Stygiobacter sp. RIFOXYC2_FULL_38_25]OGV82755.1 MAG: peptidase M64 [Stygiobacter sp. GWF2_38_21]RJQ60093.1 MAG: peptidase M64 [Stygiobacter sp.]